MAKHALLSASGASRWMACPPSARLEQNYPNKSSEFAQEGTLAHELGELTLSHKLGSTTVRKFNSEFKKIKANPLFTEDMPDYVGIYVDTCLERVSEARDITSDAVVCLEQKLNFSQWVPEGFGTGDMVIIADGTMEIIDLKYGKGIAVSAIENKQMKLYALGAIAEFSFLYDIETIKMTIVQPRLDSISTDIAKAEDLLKWADEVLAPVAQMAIKGEGEFCPGNHCGFCNAKAVCKARADKNMELTKYEFEAPKVLDYEDIAFILGRVDDLVKWSKDVQDYALARALEGEEFPGWKVVEGRGARKWTSEDEVGAVLLEQGFLENIIYTKKLTGITNMETALGKKEVNRLLGDLIEKPPGKPKMAIESDKRPVFIPAVEDFKVESDDIPF
ncbi:DUF2800 domain-containing protein [Clostridium gasigenes]|uniref:DUF2800 domain-containing protein n=1 Tax=Clostridium gasigenes TaxID=94869 RepID=UPI0016248DDD|nr:DUF2800 domain-containing protein [Clostridium gasigenes]MBB6622059.1 DUF2800 domain-containing protein [Clostridium gasigenes]